MYLDRGAASTSLSSTTLVSPSCLPLTLPSSRTLPTTPAYGTCAGVRVRPFLSRERFFSFCFYLAVWLRYRPRSSDPKFCSTVVNLTPRGLASAVVFGWCFSSTSMCRGSYHLRRVFAEGDLVMAYRSCLFYTHVLGADWAQTLKLHFRATRILCPM